MKRSSHAVMRLGDLVVAAFDEAALQSSDPKEVSRLATRTVRYLLRAVRRAWAPASSAGADGPQKRVRAG
jgi:hypothetical protein